MPKSEKSRKARKVSLSSNVGSSSSSSRNHDNTSSPSLNHSKSEKTKVKSEKVQKPHKVTDVVIIKYRDHYYFNSFFSRLSVGEKAHIIKSLKRTPIFVRVEGKVEEDYLKTVTNYMRQFKQAFYPCHLKPSTLMFSFKVIAQERGSEIELEFLDGKEFVKKAKEGTVDPSQFRAIIDLDFQEIIWRDEEEIPLTISTQPCLEIVDVNDLAISLNSDVVSDSESITSDTVLDKVEIIEEEDEVNIDEIDFDEEFEMDLLEEKAENNLFLEGQHEFITKLFNIEMIEKVNSSRPEFDPKFFPNSYQTFRAIEESVKIFVGSSDESTTNALDTCLKYLHSKSKDIYQCKNFQLFEASSLQIYIIHCLKIVRAECFARSYHPTRLEHELFKKIALANMKGAIACSKLMVTSSLNYFFTEPNTNACNMETHTVSSSADNNPNLEQLLGKLLKLSGK